MNLNRKWKLAGRGLVVLSTLALLTGCRENQRTITASYSSATASSQTSLERTDQEREAERHLKQSPGWVDEVAAASERLKAEAEITAVAEIEEVTPEAESTSPVAEEERVFVEATPMEPAYEVPAVESLEPVQPMVEIPVEPEPVYAYAPTYEEVVLPYLTQYIPNPQMDNDQFIIHQAGVNGKEIHTWLHAYKDGVWESKHVTKTSRLEPVPEILEVGTNVVVVPGRSTYEQEVAKMKERFPEVFE